MANHTITHKNLCQNPTAQAGEIDEAADDHRADDRRQAAAVSRAVRRALREPRSPRSTARELPDVGWNLDPQDWKKRQRGGRSSTTSSQKLSHLDGRGILLLHDTHLASVRALPAVLDWLARENDARRRARRARP